MAYGILYFGKILNDMQMGHNAGVVTAAAMWGAADPASVKAEKPTYLLSKPEDLLTI